MKYIGKLGEYLILAELLKLEIEAYPAIKTNQEHYDITVISRNSRVIRLQVKATDVNNRSTNNSIKNIDKEYDFLILVMISDIVKFYVMSKSEAITIKGRNVELSTTRKSGNISVIKNEFLRYENAWEKIKNA